MKSLKCPSTSCTLPTSGPEVIRVVRAGFFYRKAVPRKVQRYRCKHCGGYFSDSALGSTYYQKRPDLNEWVYELSASHVSQRRIAKILKVSRRTIERKFRLTARRCGRENGSRQEALRHSQVEYVQFDDLITSIHTKCKPAAVTLAIDAQTREILGFQVSDIPARHPLIEISRAKYGLRPNEHPQALHRLFQTLRQCVSANATFRSDSDPEYPPFVKAHFPHAVHERVLSRRGRTAGFGELKRIGFDPIFSLNHTCAMLRANLNRLARRTWSTSKTKLGLLMHLEIYTHYHNTQLLKGNAG